LTRAIFFTFIAEKGGKGKSHFFHLFESQKTRYFFKTIPLLVEAGMSPISALLSLYLSPVTGHASGIYHGTTVSYSLPLIGLCSLVRHLSPAMGEGHLVNIDILF